VVPLSNEISYESLSTEKQAETGEVRITEDATPTDPMAVPPPSKGKTAPLPVSIFAIDISSSEKLAPNCPIDVVRTNGREETVAPFLHIA
jgi:hypothetical protein